MCYVVLATLPEVEVIQRDSHQPQQDGNNNQEDTNSGVFEDININFIIKCTVAQAQIQK